MVATSDLANQFSRLKAQSGRSYDTLASKLHTSRSSLHRYCTGGALPPDLEMVEHFADACGASTEERAALLRSWELAAASRGSLPAASGAEDDAARDGQAPIVPWPGLRRTNLPYAVGDFTGRRAEIARLLGTLESEQANGRGPVVHVLDGMAGVGKSTLAIHIAHLMAARYPDAQLFVDLRGHSQDRAPLTPAEALRKLLHASGVPDAEVPDDVDERASVWRASLAGERALIVLDDAADTAQVRALLPGSRGCLVLVTSRQRMTDLQGASTTTLDPLRGQEAVELFLRIAGDEWSTDRVAAARTARLCAGLPLALRIAATRLRSRPAWTTQYLNQRLSKAGHRLAELSVGDQNVATAFHQSYRGLSDMQQRAFRLPSLHPGPTVDPHVVAGLLDVGFDEAERLLEDLVDRCLFQEPAAGTYQYHELVREYALDLVRSEEGAESDVRVERVGMATKSAIGLLSLGGQ